MMCNVSVIVPVYNTEKYLRACLDSLAVQTLGGMEVVVVNDGSTDGSLAIAEEFAKKYPWFRVYSIENKGVSHARNYGAACSRGQYIAFVDSDDDVEPDYCKAMYEKAVRDGNDVVMCRLDHIVNRNGKAEHITYPKSFWEEDNFCLCDHPELFANMSTGPYNKLVKRELFFSIRFDEDVRCAEDHLYCVKLFMLAGKIGIIKQILYHYYHIHHGVTSRFGPERLDQVVSMERIDQFMKRSGYYEKFQRELEYFHTGVFGIYSQVIRPHDASNWDTRRRFVCQTQDFLRKYYPHWRRNPYYMEKMMGGGNKFRSIYYNYGKIHALALIYASRFTPYAIYKRILHVDYKVISFFRKLRWGTIGYKACP